MSVDLNRRTELYRAANSFEAQLLKLELQAGGVHVFVENEELSMGVGDLPMGWTTAPRLMVPVGEYAQAKHLLDQLLKTRQQARETNGDEARCLNCNAVLKANQCEVCGWSCDVNDGSPDDPRLASSEPTESTGDTLGMQLPLAASQIREAWIDVFMAVGLGAIPSVTYIVALRMAGSSGISFEADWTSFLFSSIGAGIAVICLMRRRGLTMAQWGIPRWHAVDLILGGILGMVALMVSEIVTHSMPPAWFEWVGADPIRPPLPQFWWHFPLMVFALAANSIAVEFAGRAWLVTRLSQLLKHRRQAILVSSLCLGGYHLYHGPAHAIWGFAMSMLMGVSFVVSGRIWPVIIAHAMYLLGTYLSPVIWPEYYS